jgi:hypothetical protein
MKNNTTKTTKKSTTKNAVAEKRPVAKDCDCQNALKHENEIIMRSLLATSLLINLFFLVGWVAVMVSSDYAHAVGTAIYNL